MDDFEKYLNEQLKNEEFAKRWYEDEILYTISKNIIRKRSELNMTHEELAELTDIGINTLYDLETGNMDIPIMTLDKIAKALNTKVSCITKEF